MTPQLPPHQVTEFSLLFEIPNGNKGNDEVFGRVQLITHNLGRTWVTYTVAGINGHMVLDSNGMTQKTYAKVKAHIQEMIDRLDELWLPSS